ncbi:MAG TPA: D-alanyl-D-alanine carboxypeptidase [Cyclobacteriaceae bacterium]|nr:D-alanyl-D-alanine carboxypeptidase [Cyclobacteriaceae bacterium]
MSAINYGLIGCLLLGACSSQRFLIDELKKAESNTKGHVGFVLYDPVLHKTLYDHEGDRYFIPASNTKIFTFYTSLRLLGDSIPAIHYVHRNDSVILWGTGDPGFLYKKLPQGKVYDFLKAQPGRLIFSSSNFYGERMGPGWGWDDYAYAYQVERTAFPAYGNFVNVRISGDTIKTIPAFFNQAIVRKAATKDGPEITREIDTNTFNYFPGIKGEPVESNVPLRFRDELLMKLLSDTLRREVTSVPVPYMKGSKTFYSVHADSLYKVMMQESDNFIAEQLLLMCADKLSDSLRSEIAIQYSKKNLLSDLPDEPMWVDGSGLSRYNLMTPRSIVALWEKIYAMVPRERLFPLLAIGGQAGTIKNYYKAENPYIFGKTGTLRNNHSLSGYLVTRKGKTLIFSWMNNNFTSPSREVRATMESVLKTIYEKY